MRFFKVIINGDILAIGEGDGGTEIAEAEYATILRTIDNKPLADAGYDYKLKTDLTWELFESPA